jgi:hypothetical protein
MGEELGTLTVFVYGGTAADRSATLKALTDDFTKTEHGASEEKALESRKTWFGLGSTKPFDIMLATLLHQAGASAEITRQLLGHSDLTVLKRYLFPEEELKARAVEAMGRELGLA